MYAIRVERGGAKLHIDHGMIERDSLMCEALQMHIAITKWQDVIITDAEATRSSVQPQYIA